MAECIFCKIISGEIPSQTVYENEYAKVIVDIHPKAPVHLLVLGKAMKGNEHIVSAADISDSDGRFLAGMFGAAQEGAKKYNLVGYKLVFNVGREGGQVIDHIHMHILGGWNDDKKIINV